MDQQSKITDNRRFGFFMTDNEIMDHYAERLGVYSLSVYVLLVRLAGDGNYCCLSHDTIAGKLSISRRKVIYAIQKLEEENLVSVERRVTENGAKASNGYTILARGK